MLFGTIILYIRILIGIAIMIMRSDLIYKFKNCEQEHCIYPDFTDGMIAVSIINSIFIVSQACLSLILSIRIRLNASPDYCIQTTEMVKYQHFKYAHKQEIWFFTLQMIIHINYGFECRIIGRAFEVLNYVTVSNGSLEGNIYNDVLVSAIFLIIIEVLKMIFDASTATKSLIGFIKAQSTDQANYLQQCMVKVQTDNMLNLEKVLSSYCPQTGILIKGRLWNIKQICELINSFSETSLLITTLFLHFHIRTLFGQVGLSNIYCTSDILILFIIIKAVIKILKHFYGALMSRPPQLKVSDLNEALLLRRYQKLGSSLQLTQKIPIKGQKMNNNQQSNNLKKSGFDQKLGIATNTKSDRSIVIKKGSIVQLIDEVIDYIPESIQIPMDPISNKSMKNIHLKYQ